MRIAFLGLPGSGKTTVFNAVAETPVEVAYHAEPHVQVVKVHDRRLDHLRDMFQPKKFTPAGLELWDAPGLPEGADERDKERRIRLLASLREADAYVIVLRGFRTESYAYEREAPDPAADLARIVEELVTADFVVAEGRMARLQENLKRGVRTKDDDRLELAVVEKCVERLEAGRGLADLELDEADEKRIRGFQFFARKPLLVLVNGPDEVPDGLGADSPLAFRETLALDAQLEAEVAAMDPDERPAFLEEFGIEEPAAERFAHAVYRGVGLISFFTVGDDEVRAWTLKDGQGAVDAAGKIHTDLARGFVRAEVYAYDEIAEAGGEKELKAKGLMRLEAKGYVVKDGEIVHIRSAT